MPSTCNQSITDEEIESFLFHLSSLILTNLENFIQPSLKNRQIEWQDTQILKQIKLQNEWQKRCDVAFEEFDFYCTNVLGVESDILPLFPSIDVCHGDNDDNPNTVDPLEKHSCQVAECVVKPMRSELKHLSAKFLRLLVNCSRNGEAINEKESTLKNEPLTFGKCFGKDIHEAVAYYKQYSSFVSSSQWNFMPKTSSEKEVEEKNETEPVMQTLMQFTEVNGDIGTTINRESLVSTFIDSHSTRVNLVADLQNLESFLSSRKQELASSFSKGSLTSIADTIHIEWTRWCVTARGKNPQLTHSDYRFEDISTDDVLRLHSAVSNILAHIVGNGLQAKRLRFLADAVGFPCPHSAIYSGNATELEINEETKGTDTWRFRLICRRATELARNMAWCQDQRELSLQSVARARDSVEEMTSEVNVIRNRIEWIQYAEIEFWKSVSLFDISHLVFRTWRNCLPRRLQTSCAQAIQRWQESDKERRELEQKENQDENPDVEPIKVTPVEEITEINLCFQIPPIAKLDNKALGNLKKCKKLSLSTNMIDRMVNLTGMLELEILSLGRNNIKKIEKLEDVAGTLKQLWISYNQISSLDGLACLTNLTTLYCSNNLIKSYSELEKLQANEQLTDVVFCGNPMYGDETGGNREAVRRAARVEILRRLPNLKTIDGQLVKREEIEAAQGELPPE
ncbi:hypothetical protein ACHAXS_007133 [Conticribra weissflogii]